MISAAWSNRSRDSFMSTPNASYSIRASPRPKPSRSRPSQRMSSIATFSATRVGLGHHGKMIAPVPSFMRSVLPASQASHCMLSGIIE